MRFVKYASTITTRTAPFWPTAGPALRTAWKDYWSCRRDPACRPSLCAARHLSPGSGGRPAIWTRSVLAQQALADERAAQWRLPELVLWPNASWSGDRLLASSHMESPAMAELRPTCAAKAPALPGYGLDSCMRNVWLHNLTQFLGARKKFAGSVVSVG